MNIDPAAIFSPLTRQLSPALNFFFGPSFTPRRRPMRPSCHLCRCFCVILIPVATLASSAAERLQGFTAAGGYLLLATTPPPPWRLDARAEYDARSPLQPRGSRIHKALHAPADYTLVGAFDSSGVLVGAISYRVRALPADLFVTSLGSTGDLPGTGVALLAHLAQVSLDAGLAVRASLDPIAISFYQSLGWIEIEPGAPGHQWHWPLVARTELAELAVPTLPEPAL
jgi:hypothetical protein